LVIAEIQREKQSPKQANLQQQANKEADTGLATLTMVLRCHVFDTTRVFSSN
jgi:hypothetical protein